MRYCDLEAFLTAQFSFSFPAPQELAVSQDHLAARCIILTWKEERGKDIKVSLQLLEVCNLSMLCLLLQEGEADVQILLQSQAWWKLL